MLTYLTIGLALATLCDWSETRSGRPVMKWRYWLFLTLTWPLAIVLWVHISTSHKRSDK